MTREDLKAKLVELLHDMLDSEQFITFNEYAEHNNYATMRQMSELDEDLGSMTPTQIVNFVWMGDGFNPNEDYYVLDGNDITSYEWVADYEDWDEEVIADDIIDNPSEYSNDDIKELIEEYEQSEDIEL